MKLVKSLLLGSAAGLCAVAGAQAADLPARRAAPVEYVRVCTAYGAGFFFIPGTDTCLRVGGRARFEYQYVSNRTRNNDVSGFRGLGRLNIDARTQTGYGTLRAFVRFELASRTGAQLTSGTQQRYANAFPAIGQDTFGRAQQYVNVDKAFVQFAGFTAGRASSFYDFYAHDLEFVGVSVGSDVFSTNLLAYTLTFGQGWSATISMEDPIFRRSPTFGTIAALGTAALGSTTPTASTTFFVGQGVFTGVGTSFAANGAPLSAVNIDVQQRNHLPDFVGALRYDAPWGAAQISAAVHELRTGNFASAAFGVNGGVVPVGQPVARVPSAEYGWAVQGGLKLNLPQIATGDVLWLQAAYGQGANAYTGITVPQGSEVLGAGYTNRFTGANVPGGYDMAIDANGRAHLTESWSGSAAFLHYWSPQWRQAFFGSYGRATFDKALRGPASPLIGTFFNAAGPTGTGAALFSGFGKDYSNIVAGSNLIWSPVKDLDIGVEALYQRMEFLGGASRGRVVDANKPVTVGGVPRSVKVDDNVIVRMRVQRDF
ncbi:porin [Enterovirga sp.]|uniref:porin n=1 Tax=Enterovirga sp. TaxID=2026350 RepID=UPI00262EE86A|nr:porin [Enterovirga sp.]MDB5592716.1 porin [Enterovirga sp.]